MLTKRERNELQVKMKERHMPRQLCPVCSNSMIRLTPIRHRGRKGLFLCPNCTEDSQNKNLGYTLVYELPDIPCYMASVKAASYWHKRAIEKNTAFECNNKRRERQNFKESVPDTDSHKTGPSPALQATLLLTLLILLLQSALFVARVVLAGIP